MIYPHKWSPISCKSSAGQGSSPTKDRRSTTAVPRNQLYSIKVAFYLRNTKIAFESPIGSDGN